jgi:hypothetical protein
VSNELTYGSRAWKRERSRLMRGFYLCSELLRVADDDERPWVVWLRLRFLRSLMDMDAWLADVIAEDRAA